MITTSMIAVTAANAVTDSNRMPARSAHQREKSFRTATEAKGFKAKFEHDSREHSFTDPRDGKVTFLDAATRYIGVPLTDVSAWLGHRDVNVTYQTYSHLIPDAWERGRAALEALAA